ncbi:hypothetical protein [Gloeothece citriformis]|nr:hypothetical protein [Gloeothece citriformis]
MNQSRGNLQINWGLITKVILEGKQRQELGELPFTYYYQKSGSLIGSFFCGDEEGEFILFFNLNYPDSAVILQLIAQHCQVLKEEILVYPLDSQGIELYSTVTPEKYIILDL